MLLVDFSQRSSDCYVANLLIFYHCCNRTLLSKFHSLYSLYQRSTFWCRNTRRYIDVSRSKPGNRTGRLRGYSICFSALDCPTRCWTSTTEFSVESRSRGTRISILCKFWFHWRFLAVLGRVSAMCRLVARLGAWMRCHVVLKSLRFCWDLCRTRREVNGRFVNREGFSHVVSFKNFLWAYNFILLLNNCYPHNQHCTSHCPLDLQQKGVGPHSGSQLSLRPGQRCVVPDM